jgi:protein TonB
MLEPLRRLKREQLFGLLFVLALHGAVLYGLWSYRILPTADEAIVLMVNLINPPPPEQPKPKPQPPKPPPPKPVEPPKPQQLAAETPVVLPDETVVYAPPPPPPPPVIEAPPQPVMLSGELSVTCPERAPPDYPLLSKRLNEQGKVVLRVELGEDGRIEHAEVKTSSAYRRLDEVALSTVKTWRCKPATRNGVAVRAVALQPFNFILEGR